MKEELYMSIICKEFCKFYKEGKEKMRCGGYELLRNNLTFGELLELSRYLIGETSMSQRDIKGNHKIEVFSEQYALNEILTNFVCDRCEFQINGCDFRDGLATPPCGGYIFISRLMGYFKDTHGGN